MTGRIRHRRRRSLGYLLILLLAVSCTSGSPRSSSGLAASTTAFPPFALPPSAGVPAQSSGAPSSGAPSSGASPASGATAPATGATAPQPGGTAVPTTAGAVHLTEVALTAVVSHRQVTVDTTIAAAPDTTFDLVGVCARSSAGANVDFPTQAGKTIIGAGTSVVTSRMLLPGSYTYWPCAKLGTKWHDVGPRKTVVVPAINISGQAMPTGNLPRWRQIFTDDFNTDVPLGGFPGPYADKWSGYDGFGDTSGVGRYAERIISVHDGVLDLYLHSEDGTPLGAAPVPLLAGDGKWGGQTYGRYVIRFTSDALPGFGTGWLLWPDSGDWNDGEIDFPEGSLAHHIQGFNHCLGNPHKKCLSVDTATPYTGWHTAVIDWLPNRLTFELDGVTIGSTTKDVPHTPMRWTLQSATNGAKPAPDTAGHLRIDWVAIYAPD